MKSSTTSKAIEIGWYMTIASAISTSSPRVMFTLNFIKYRIANIGSFVLSILPSVNMNSGLFLVKNAVTILSGVGVVSLGHNSGRSGDVLKGLRRQATVASVVVESTGAIDELLLGKSVVLVQVNRFSGFDIAGCREGPAGSALALVFYWRDLVVFAPIPRCWHRLLDALG
jgi:hypothetical protein